MKTIVKGTIATATGVTLLLGGAGTFALWNTSAETAGGTIVSGGLEVEPSAEAATWTVNGGAPQSTIAGYPIVPGDVVVYSRDMTVTAYGDGLNAAFSLDPASIEPSSTSSSDVALADYLSSTAQLTATGDGITTTPDAVTVTGRDGLEEDVTVAVTIEFPKSTTVGFENDTQLGSVDLGAVAVTLTQI